MNALEKISAALFIVIVCCLVAIGIMISYSASSYNSYIIKGDDMYFLKMQLKWLVIAVVAAGMAAFIPLRAFEKMTVPLFIAAVIILLLVYVPGIGVATKGAKRWIVLAGYQFQPSELAKICIIMFNAWWFSHYRKNVEKLFMGNIIPLLISGIPLFLILRQPDFGLPAITGLTLILVIFANGAKLWHISIIFLAGLAVSILDIIKKSYRLGRLHEFFSKEPEGQVLESLIAISYGSIYGLGIGNSVAKLSYLPEAHTDFIFAIFAEEFGFVGTAGLIILYFFLMIFMYIMLRKVTNIFGKLLGYSILIMFLLQTLINLGVVTALLPTKGLTLPLMSYGGTSLLSWFILFGLFYNITCVEKRDKIIKKAMLPGVGIA